MMAVLVALGLIVLTALLVVLIGGALLSCTAGGRSLKGLELLAYSIGFGILGLAILGIGTVSISWDYERNAWLLLSVTLVASVVQWSRSDVFSRLFGSGAGEAVLQSRLAALGWLLMAAIPMLMTFVPIKMPSELPDGAYVIKNDHLHVKVQVMLGAFPADNFIPFAATEYLLRDIPFAEERPLMPGQELANRPILMSLAAVPLRAALDAPQKLNGPLPTFRYVGRQWPDVGRFGDDRSYRRFLAVSLVLNASLFIGAALLFQYFGLSRGYWVAGLLVFGSSPYFVAQTLFAWPKSLAAFFLVLSAFTLLARKPTWIAGLLGALAYWSHPYAVVFLGAFGLYLLIRERNDMNPSRGLLPFAVVAFGGLAIWWLWANWYLQLSSDLVEQNLSVGASLASHAEARFVNLLNAIAPISFRVLPTVGDLVQASLHGIVGAVGILLLPPAAFASVQCIRQHSKEFVLLLALPSALLIGVFSVLSIPAVHGLQAVSVALLMLSLRWMQQRNFYSLMLACASGQIAINIVLLLHRGHALLSG
ncbi:MULTISPECIES: hypothetical protein [Xanthomonas]|uniref:hypothetical protein n=1 Tax=Xanthomonas TaxID=338 RepID=UPI001ADB37D4|nr:hypothetical protein [Xanthomonas phaseoli]MBO9768121.1 hypothetical protein [Xanthomonas phaseoli pv. dieffenbachiae]MBO9776405.1 hypothetical protein [Xanthomonas phaseoli pv. dieffenbachiae]MBO9778690.1 hypothetical protein [Xanthomonas phaseoli pv. dieffenbachiae]MBO9797880.1 hypothetical protein [Xanthomonas phaseoli pv. dieffenbachiae]MBO9799338.1 hypothetical protein [Xanthomonas phaseoli pv. dieffenbachiae]